MKDGVKNALLLGVIALICVGIAAFTYFKFTQTQKERLAAEEQLQQDVAGDDTNLNAPSQELDENDYLDEALLELDLVSQQ